MRKLIADRSRDYKFLIGIFVGILGIIGIDYLLVSLKSTFSLLSWINNFFILKSGVSILILSILIIYIIILLLKINKKIGLLLQETHMFVSDEETTFIGSPDHTRLPAGTKAAVAESHPNWINFDRLHCIFYKELQNAKWIADRKNITNEEALSGGQYNFEREINVSFKKERLLSAHIVLLVDDFCELIVNDHKFEEVKGYENVHFFDILKDLKEGSNKIRFIVKNLAGKEWKNDEFQQSQIKFRYNPYGVKFCVVFKYYR